MTLTRKSMTLVVLLLLGTAGLGWSMSDSGQSATAGVSCEVCDDCCGLCD